MTTATSLRKSIATLKTISGDIKKLSLAFPDQKGRAKFAAQLQKTEAMLNKLNQRLKDVQAAEPTYISPLDPTEKPVQNGSVNKH